MSAMDVTHLTPRGVEVTHHDGPIKTDGPWLALLPASVTAGGRGAPDLEHLYPAHAVVSVDPCEGRCHDGGE